MLPPGFEVSTLQQQYPVVLHYVPRLGWSDRESGDGQLGPCMGQCMMWCMAWCMGGGGGGDVDDVVGVTFGDSG